VDKRRSESTVSTLKLVLEDYLQLVQGRLGNVDRELYRLTDIQRSLIYVDCDRNVLCSF